MNSRHRAYLTVMLLDYLQIIAYNRYGSDIAQCVLLNRWTTKDKEFLRTIINSKIRNGDELFTYLIRAVESGVLEQVIHVLELGARINDSDSDGWTPLMCAIGADSLAIVTLLMERGARIRTHSRGWTPLYLTSFRANPELASYLCAQGCSGQDSEGFSPLLGACWIGDLELVTQLVEAGADIEWLSRSGQTALMVAAERGWTPIVQYLCNKGARTFTIDNFGRTAVSLAQLRNYSTIVECLN